MFYVECRDDKVMKTILILFNILMKLFSERADKFVHPFSTFNSERQSISALDKTKFNNSITVFGNLVGPPPRKVILKKSDRGKFFLTGFLGGKKVCRTGFLKMTLRGGQPTFFYRALIGRTKKGISTPKPATEIFKFFP